MAVSAAMKSPCPASSSPPKLCVSGSLQDLLCRLGEFRNSIGVEALRIIFNEALVADEELRPWIRFDAKSYSRNLIAREDSFELYVMCWASGQVTAIHDHAGSACAVRVVAGTASEITYEQSPCGVFIPSEINHFGAGEVFCSFDSALHQMGNFGAAQSSLITLHCYSPPLGGIRVVDGEMAFFNTYEAVYRSFLGR